MEFYTNQYDVGIIIGRFQVDKLHIGHQDLINFVINRHKKVIIFLGISNIPGTKHDPLDYECRKQLILSKYPNLIILPINDCRDDLDWSFNLDKRINEVIGPLQSVVLYGARDSFIPFYCGKYNTQVLNGEGNLWTGTTIRESLKNQAQNADSFRAGAMWQTYNRYPHVISVVDIAIVKDNKLLLCQKSYDKDEWGFIGGFSDCKSQTLEEDAIREAKEETGLELNKVEYVCNLKLDDWRYRKNDDKLHTTLFFSNDFTGYPVASDDIQRCEFFKLDKLTENNMVQVHKQLFNIFKTFFEKKNA